MAGVLVIWLLIGLPAAYAMVSYRPVVKSMTFEMGTVCFDDVKIVKHDFGVLNDTKKTIHFAKPQSFCGCTNTRLTRDAISPGECTTLTMEVNLDGKIGPKTFSTTLVDDKKKVWSFHIQATTYKTLSFDPEGVYIGPLKPRATVKRKVTVVSCVPKGRDTLPKVVVGPMQGPIAVDRTNENSVAHEDGITKNTESFEVRVTAGDNPGLYSYEIMAQSEESGRTHTARIPVTWTVESLYSVSPPRVFVDSFASNNSPVEAHLSIETLDGTPFEVHRVMCNNPAVTCELLATESSNSKRRLKVAVSPIRRDYLYCELEIETNLPSQSHIVIPVVAVNLHR